MLVNTNMAVKHNDIPPKMPSEKTAVTPLNKKHFNTLLQSVGKNQDKEAFIELFEHFAPRIKSFLMKGGSSPEQADELAQETMLAIWRKARSYDPKQAAASTWIFTVARNKRIDLLRKTKRHDPNPSDPLLLKDESNGPSENVIQLEETTRIAQVLKTLPEEQADLVKKSFFEDKSHAAIAEETGIALGTVKSRIRLALERLRKDTKVKDLWNS